MVFEIRINKLKIPVFDIATLVASFYIGYSESKGVDASPLLEYACKFGPTAVAAVVAPAIIKAYQATAPRAMKNIKPSDPQRHLKLEAYDAGERKLQKEGYLGPTIKAAERAALETLVGYAAGKVYGLLT